MTFIYKDDKPYRLTGIVWNQHQHEEKTSDEGWAGGDNLPNE